MRFAFLALIVAALGSQATAEPAVENFRRGINLSHWYAQSFDGTYEEDRLSTYFTEADAKLIKEMGFDHVRLTLNDAVLFSNNGSELKAEPLKQFRQRLDMILNAGVNVLVDLHPEDGYKQSMNEPEAAERLAMNWGRLAEALGDTDPSHVWFEVMNEPHGIDRDRWREIQEQAVVAIHAAAPEHAIVVSGGSWTNAATLHGDGEFEGDAEGAFEAYDPSLADGNLVYTFHYYDPHLYTHQGAGWAWEVAQRVKGLNWPTDPKDAERIAGSTVENGDDEAFGHVKYHVEAGRGTRQYLVDHFDKIAAWQKANGDVPVYLGEFGVYAEHAPREGRLAWTKAVVEEAEKRGWGWAMWDYSGGFAVAPGEPGQREPDEEMLTALGLK